MTRPESVADDIEVIDDIEGIENIEFIAPIEPGSLEWFRSHAPLPLLLQAFFEDVQHRAEFSRYEGETAKSACKNHISFWEMLYAVEEQAACLKDFDDPNAKAIVARLKSLNGPQGFVFYNSMNVHSMLSRSPAPP